MTGWCAPVTRPVSDLIFMPSDAAISPGMPTISNSPRRRETLSVCAGIMRDNISWNSFSLSPYSALSGFHEIGMQFALGHAMACW